MASPPKGNATAWCALAVCELSVNPATFPATTIPLGVSELVVLVLVMAERGGDHAGDDAVNPRPDPWLVSCKPYGCNKPWKRPGRPLWQWPPWLHSCRKRGSRCSRMLALALSEPPWLVLHSDWWLKAIV